MSNTTNNIFPKIDKLIDDWCESRRLKPLRFILRSYPLCSGLTDEWGSCWNLRQKPYRGNGMRLRIS